MVVVFPGEHQVCGSPSLEATSGCYLCGYEDEREEEDGFRLTEPLAEQREEEEYITRGYFVCSSE